MTETKKDLPLWRDHLLNVDDRVKDLLSRMTLEEKMSQMMNESVELPALGIPQYNWWSEALHGVARAGRATVFPEPIGMAATFDRTLILHVAGAVADEVRAKHHGSLRAGAKVATVGLTCWSPNVNIFRDPRWGRGQETWGEDPYLTGELGSQYVRGLQGQHQKYLKVAACAKHYAVHSGPEASRHTFDARVGKRDLRETYLPAFKACVDAGVESVMGAYNRVNSEPACSSETLLVKILRGEWKFAGHVVSDCGAVEDIHRNHKVAATPEEGVALAVKAGCDLECGCLYKHMVSAVKQGLLTEKDIDTCLGRLLRTRMKLGMFDPEALVPYASIPVSVVGCERHRTLARSVAEASIVLLKNQNGILPLRQKRMLVTGPNAAEMGALLGNYYGMNERMVTVLEGIVGRAPDDVKLDYLKGCPLSGPFVNNPQIWQWVMANMDVLVAVVGLTEEIEGEEGASILSAAGGDRPDLRLPEAQRLLLAGLCAQDKPVVLIIASGGPVDVSEFADRCAAILWVGYPGQEGGNAVARVLFGDVSPGGRLPITWPRSVKVLPPFEEYSMKGRTYKYMEEKSMMFPFGFGLSYAKFSYTGLRMDSPTVKKGQSLKVSVEVKNEGKVAADEVVQVYLRDEKASVPVPQCKLAGFDRIHLSPGGSKRVEFTIPAAALAVIDDAGMEKWEEGAFTVFAGGCPPFVRCVELGLAKPLEAVLRLLP